MLRMPHARHLETAYSHDLIEGDSAIVALFPSSSSRSQRMELLACRTGVPPSVWMRPEQENNKKAVFQINLQIIDGTCTSSAICIRLLVRPH
eukprot:556432-Pelagomonas_calceolata.AAC.1